LAIVTVPLPLSTTVTFTPVPVPPPGILAGAGIVDSSKPHNVSNLAAKDDGIFMSNCEFNLQHLTSFVTLPNLLICVHVAANTIHAILVWRDLWQIKTTLAHRHGRAALRRRLLADQQVSPADWSLCQCQIELP